MKNYLFFLCFLSLTNVQAMFDLPEMDEDNQFFVMRELQDTACDIQTTLTECKSIPTHYAEEVGLIIKKLSDIKLNKQQVNAIKQAVRRYQTLANACKKADPESPIMSSQISEIISLLQERELVVTKIHDIVNPTIHSHLVMHSLPATLGHEPSAEEKADLTKQHHEFIMQQNKKRIDLEKQLLLIETALLSDRRTLLDKYLPLALGTTAVIATLVCAGALYNYYQPKWAAKKKQ